MIHPDDYKTSQELEKELSELKMRIAFKRLEEMWADRLIRESASPGQELKKAVDEADPRMMSLIEEKSGKRTVKSGHKVLFRVLGAVACVLLLFYISLTVAIAAIPTVRHSALKFFMNIGEQYASIGFKETEEYVDVPQEWKEDYYPTYIPDGFSVDAVSSNDVLYSNGAERTLSFVVLGQTAGANIDTEDANVSWEDINGFTALVSETVIGPSKEKGPVIIVWNIGNKYLIVDFDGTKEEALQIARSVQLIN